MRARALRRRGHFSHNHLETHTHTCWRNTATHALCVRACTRSTCLVVAGGWTTDRPSLLQAVAASVPREYTSGYCQHVSRWLAATISSSLLPKRKPWEWPRARSHAFPLEKVWSHCQHRRGQLHDFTHFRHFVQLSCSVDSSGSGDMITNFLQL